MKWDKFIEVTTAIGGAGVTYLFGGMDKLLSALLLFAAIDFLLGVGKGAAGKSDKTKNGRLSSVAASAGLEKKGKMLLVLIVANVCDGLFDAGGVVRDGALWFYIAVEALSICENITLIGIPLPKFLIDLLEVRKNMADAGKGDTNEDIH